MTPQPPEHSRYVKQTFIKIARHYDFMNRLMSGGADQRWRKEAIQLAALKHGELVLDIGSGTGDLARAARKAVGGLRIIATDFTYTMLTQKNDWQEIYRSNTDALLMPFADSIFDAIISGFLLRNVGDVDTALQEQYRMLKPGGKIVVLDTTKPRKSVFLPLVNFYLLKIMPLLGTVLTCNKEAYTYLPESTRDFLMAEDLAARMVTAGFTDVEFRIRMFGSVAIHSGTKPLN